MAVQYAYLGIGLLVLFGLIGICVGLLASLIKNDSWNDDETYIWMRKIKE